MTYYCYLYLKEDKKDGGKLLQKTIILYDVMERQRLTTLDNCCVRDDFT